MSTGSLKIRQSWLSDEIDVVAEDTGRSKDDAFALLASSLLAGCSVDDLDDADWVDGGQDKQIDIININSDEDKGVAHITIIQAKNTSGFGSNTMIKIRNGLDWIFERTRAEVDTLDNVKFRNKILEIRSIRTDIRPSKYVCQGSLCHGWGCFGYFRRVETGTAHYRAKIHGGWF